MLKVIKNARNLYKQVIVYQMSIRDRCCNFQLLEEKCNEFNHKKEDE